jgi:hypothetical protein
MATLILTNEFKSILEKQEIIDALATNGYNNAESFVKEILKRLNKFDSSLNLKSISYHNLQDSDTYIGIILDEYLNKLYNVCVIPPILGTRSGFLSQQIFGFISNLINGQMNKNPYSLCDKPVIIVNCMVDSLANSAICNIIGSKIAGFHYIDIFNRNEDFGNSILNLRDYVDTVSQYKDISKDVELTSDTLILKTQRLKDFSTSLTNEPYYFAITAYPAVILAKKEGYTIDVKDFEEKLSNGKSNKNIDAFLKFVKDLKTTDSKSESMYLHNQLQLIYYGAPGTGKSYATKQVVAEYPETIRTTFHPDSDYSTFVGAYKPTTTKEERYGLNGSNTIALVYPEGEKKGKPIKDGKIAYKFVKQAFLKAYIKAWRFFRDSCADGKELSPQFLVIEEINRGNCAQIFGDLFQLLDRKNGFSEYPIEADEDIQKALLEEEPEDGLSFGKDGMNFTAEQITYINQQYDIVGQPSQKVAEKIRLGQVLVLPPNFYIWATMNTSDQSLFPIDSAFKRRWEWKYVRICEGKKEDGTVLDYRIKFNVPGEEPVDVKWWDFVKAINKQIEDATKSEDKKLGFFFCKPDKKANETDDCNTVISAETFVGKVVFYLWQDVFKDYGFKSNIFKRENGKMISFHDFYPEDMVADKDANPEGIDLALVKTFIQKVLDSNKEQPKTAAEE